MGLLHSAARASWRRHPADGPARRDVLLFAAFDQRIDAEAMLATVSVRAGGEQGALRLATPEEVEGDDEVARLAAQAEDGRWLAFRARETLPADSAVTVTVGAGRALRRRTPGHRGASGVELPHLRALPGARARVWLGRASVLTARPVAYPLHQPGRREDVPRGDGPRGSSRRPG